MAEKIYARLVDGQLAEYPVFPIHIQNRAHPLDWYTEVQFDDQPEVPPFHSLSETLKVKNGQVFASYTVTPLSVDTLLYQAWHPDGAAQELETLAFEDIDPALRARIIELVRQEVQKRLDGFAASKNYDGILSAASYVGSANATFDAEGRRAVELRDSTWMTLYQNLAQIQAGALGVPKTFADVEAALPALTWDAGQP